jgi:hypothetical protein
MCAGWTGKEGIRTLLETPMVDDKVPSVGLDGAAEVWQPLRLSEDEVLARVINQGLGISEKEEGVVFELQRGSQAEKAKGHDLGLPTAGVLMRQ